MSDSPTKPITLPSTPSATRRHPLSRSPGKRSPPSRHCLLSKSTVQGGVAESAIGNFVLELPTQKLEGLVLKRRHEAAEEGEDRTESPLGSGDKVEGSVAQVTVEKEKTVHINDLCPEVLLLIFSHVHDRFGFRRPRRTGWYTPPLRLGLVCHYWLDVSRSTFYASLAVHHPARVPALHKTLSHYPAISSIVKSLSISLPDLSTTSSSESEDDVGNPSRIATYTQLRQLVAACSPTLLSLSIANMTAPSGLFPNSTLTPFVNLQQSIFHSLTSLSLTYPPPPSPATSDNLEFLPNLPWLTSLTLKNFSSSTTSSTPLMHLPPQPQRHPQLQRLYLTDCALTTTDLSSLLILATSSLHTLSITQIYQPSKTSIPPTILSLPSLIHLTRNLNSLSLSLFNYPAPPTPIVTLLIPQLEYLQNLSIAGPISSSTLLNFLPSSLKSLTINPGSDIDPESVCKFLKEGGRLKTFRVRGEGAGGWSGRLGWKVQKACWDAGVVWSGWS